MNGRTMELRFLPLWKSNQISLFGKNLSKVYEDHYLCFRIEHSGTWDGNRQQDSRHIGQLQPRQRKVPVTRRKHPRQRGFDELSGPLETLISEHFSHKQETQKSNIGKSCWNILFIIDWTEFYFETVLVIIILNFKYLFNLLSKVKWKVSITYNCRLVRKNYFSWQNISGCHHVTTNYRIFPESIYLK